MQIDSNDQQQNNTDNDQINDQCERVFAIEKDKG